MHYHPNTPPSDDDALFAKDGAAGDDDPDAVHGGNALTSQTLNADGTPKRPMNAFMIFARRRRPQVSAENQSMRTGDISKILSQEWKAMLPADKQFYLTQAKQLKESFNTRYPDYVYRRRPNNTRKRRKPDASGSPSAGAHDRGGSGGTDDDHSSPDADTSPLPDAHYPSYASHSLHRGYGGPSSAHSPYGFGSSSSPYGSNSNYGHSRNQSYPYPPASSSSSAADLYSRYDSSSSRQLLNTAYYPLYDANHPQPMPASSSSTHAHGSPNLGLRKAHSIPSMPSSLSPPLGAMGHPHAASSHHHSNSTGSSYYGHTSASHPSSASASASASYSPPTRYSPYASSSTSTSSPVPAYSPFGSSTSSSASPAPAYSASAGSPPGGYGGGGGGAGSPTAATYAGAGSPQMGHSAYHSSPRALTSGLGLNGLTVSGGAGGGGGGGALGLNGLGVSVGEDYYWRADKLL